MTIILLSLRLMVTDVPNTVAASFWLERLNTEPDYAEAYVDGELVYVGPGIALEWPIPTDTEWHQYRIDYWAGYGARFKACTNDPAQPR